MYYLTITATDYIGKTKTTGSGIKTITDYYTDNEGEKSEEKTLIPKQQKDGTYTATLTIPQGFKLNCLLTSKLNLVNTYSKYFWGIRLLAMAVCITLQTSVDAYIPTYIKSDT